MFLIWLESEMIESTSSFVVRIGHHSKDMMMYGGTLHFGVSTIDKTFRA